MDNWPDHYLAKLEVYAVPPCAPYLECSFLMRSSGCGRLRQRNCHPDP